MPQPSATAIARLAMLRQCPMLHHIPAVCSEQHIQTSHTGQMLLEAIAITRADLDEETIQAELAAILPATLQQRAELAADVLASVEF